MYKVSSLLEHTTELQLTSSTTVDIMRVIKKSGLEVSPFRPLRDRWEAC